MLFFPDFSPVLKKVENGQVFYIRMYNLPTAGKIPPIHISLTDSAGKSAEVKTFGLMQNPTMMQPQGMGLFWKLVKLPDLSPGDYKLRISATDTSQNREITRELATHVQ